MASPNSDVALANLTSSELPESRTSLEPQNTVNTFDEPISSPLSQMLPPADRGSQAWLTLAACFVLEGVIWGFPFSFGVFQAYYTTHTPFAQQSQSGIAAIGTTATGVAYLASPIAAIMFQRLPQYRRHGMLLGLVGTVISLLAASWCNSVAGLLATQGVLYGAFSLILYFPGLQYIDEWFVHRKGLAYGIMWAGTGTAGIGLPFLLQWLLDRYGFRTALRVWAVIVTVLCIPCIVSLKHRLPVSASSALRPQDLSFMKHAPFWFFVFGVMTWSLGYVLPPLWLPSFAADIHLPLFAGPLSLALYNAAFSVGAIAFGLLVDRFHVSLSIFIACVGLMVAAFVFWGLTASQPMLYIFALLWGAFGGGFTVTWAEYASVMRKLEPRANVDTGLVLSLMAAAKGLGSVVSGPLSAKLLHVGWSGHSQFAYGTPYGALVVFSGISAMFGGAACVARLLKMI